jgi:type II secretory pathway component GspD/PulD (secretin)
MSLNKFNDHSESIINRHYAERTPFMLKRLLILLAFKTMMTCCAYAESSIIEVIPLVNRPASEIQPLLEPLLENTDRAIADGSNLLVKTSPTRLAKIKSIIAKLDTHLNDLIITVLQSRQATADELNMQIRAQINVPGTDLSKSTGNISGYTYQTQDRNDLDHKQTLRTQEGKPAYIKAGNTYPIQNYQSYSSGYGYSGASSSTEYVEASTGFSVTPTLSGQQVTLEIAPWSDNFETRSRIQTQEAQTTVTVNLGEWIEIGAANESKESSSGNRAQARSWQTHENKLHILIKAEKAQ